MSPRSFLLLVAVAAAAGCPGPVSSDKVDARAAVVDAPVTGPDAPSSVSDCTPNSPDLEGCSCAPGSAARGCYPASASPSTRGVGPCKDGTQACVTSGEFARYGACTGATTPLPENCTNMIDDSCDGKVDCADLTCATAAACGGGCTTGQTRACYDGPDGTQGVGTCRPGVQTCSGGRWPANCPGEVLPQAEDCSAPLDKNCNYLPGCFDVFACLNSPACMESCKLTDPSCSCPMGTGDVATCPDGTLGIDTPGAFGEPDTVECCPCKASDCGNPGCCAEAVCAGNPMCGGLTCKPLPASCNGMVNMDCDDFPEDCDEPCCKCTTCP